MSPLFDSSRRQSTVSSPTIVYKENQSATLIRNIRQMERTHDQTILVSTPILDATLQTPTAAQYRTRPSAGK
jgi:hypothetical protein